ncbi:lung adenoma susceptibility protein 2 isoform X2 [Podarcis raffonei]|uniref:lung adenoma susceptibility protein 2 isoform X2 n=1 Tax=Podarcis raffonei TaxID=65483 RepID=UPI0023290C15|nr:lung adenoma susceptibility protein 2 isoform X2 [Podarcis raffonei]
MACLIKKGSVYSPESTVSCLLADCSLSNSSCSLKSHSSIQYKDRFYRSASQALEAYIEDFDLSLASPEVRPGKICLIQSTRKDLRSSEDSFKRKYALEKFEQQAILGSAAPHLRRKNAYDADMLSLTTDDLLAFPADGSLPFIHAAALRPVPQSINQNRKSLTASASCAHQASSFGNEKVSNFPENPSSPPYQHSSRNVYTQHRFQRYDSGHSVKDHLMEEDNSESVFHKNYPRWLTSQKSDLSVSGISSIPSFKYPVWLKSHNLLPESSNESSTWAPGGEDGTTFLENSRRLMRSQNDVERSNHPGRSGHNDLLDQQHEHEVQRNCHYDIPSAYFTPQGLKHRRSITDEGTDLILQKTRETQETSADELTNALKMDGSPCTVDVLEAERSWDNVPIGLKTPVPVCCEEDTFPQNPKAGIVNEFLEDCLKNVGQEDTFSGGNHHGPVEALKLMLFNLQAVQHSFNQNKTAGQKEELKKTFLDEDVEFKLHDHDIIPVKSLKRALHHLSRLKGLVDDPSGKE